jgi:hypothetical protein
VDINDPVKCPDCGVWWRGYLHRCDNGGGVTATVTTGGGPYVLTGTLSIPVQPDSMNVTLNYSNGYLHLAPIAGEAPLLINRDVIEVYTDPDVYLK